MDARLFIDDQAEDSDDDYEERGRKVNEDAFY